MMNKTLSTITLLIVGSAIGAVGYAQFSAKNVMTTNSLEKQPLYWVAPMDPNYRRNKPGKSPMGMALIPVYDAAPGEKDSPGTIKISPDVVNNLGVRTAAVELTRFTSHISTVGYIQYDEDKLIHIHPRVEGWLDKLYIKTKGAQVSKGQPLYDIYSPTLVNAQEELVLALDRNNKRLIRAAKGRLKALLVPLAAIDELVRTRQVKQNITIYAPQSGVIDNLAVREGFFVKPGTTMMSIGALDEVWVTAEIFERQSSFVKAGDPVTMTLGYSPGQSWQGEVDYIYPTLDPKTRTVQLRLRFANPDFQLKPNMFAQVSIANSGEETLLVPKEAVVRTGDFNRVVLALGDGKFKSIKVHIGRTNNKEIEIIDGLEQGDKVVISAQFLLDSESSVSSDFKRMNHQDEQSQQALESVWVEGIIESVMADHRMLTVTHQPIEQWQWPSMTMDFTVAEHVDMALVEKGMNLHVEVTESEGGQYLITNIHMPDQKELPQSEDHSQHQMTDIKEMDHSQHQVVEQPQSHDNASKPGAL